MAKASLAKMSVDELLRLSESVTGILSRKALELRGQLARLGSGGTLTRKTRSTSTRKTRSSLRGRKVPIKYRDRSGNTWAGRGATPVWLREKLKTGAKLQDFA